MKYASLSVLSVIALAGSTFGQAINESEPNNLFSTADSVDATSFNAAQSFVFDGTITPGVSTGLGRGTVAVAGDVDWVKFTITGTVDLVASLFGVPNSRTPGQDPQMILVRLNGLDQPTIIAADDNSNIGNWPALEAILTAGEYAIGITGYQDFAILTAPGGDADIGPFTTDSLPDGFNLRGDGVVQSFSYKLVAGFNVIPSPGATALLGVGGLMAFGRRRR